MPGNMAIIQALLLAISRRAGQLINTVFGWATQLLFGKVTQDKQLYVSGMAFGSVAWLISLIGIVLPAVGTFLLTAIPVPKWVDKDWIRLLMLGIAILLPLFIGWLGVRAMVSEERPREASDVVKALLRGYAYAFGLAVTLVLMTLFAPFMMLPLMAKRWTTQHVPLLVESEVYEEVVTDTQKILAAGGWKTTREPVSWMVSLPTKILVSLAGTLVDQFVADKLTTLRTNTLEVTIHPADLVLSGKPFEVARVRAQLAEGLAFTRANQTWTKEATDLENAATELWQKFRAGSIDAPAVRQELKRLEEARSHLEVEFEEWEVLERQQLLLERSLLDGDAARVTGDARDRIRASSLPPAAAAETPEARRRDGLVGAGLLGALMLLGSFLQSRLSKKHDPVEIG